MNYTELKTEREILARLPAELGASEVEFKDKRLRSITLRDTREPSDHILLKIQLDGYSGMEALTPTPPKLVTKWRIKGTHAGIEVSEVRDTQPEIEARLAELERAFHVGANELRGLHMESFETPEPS